MILLKIAEFALNNTRQLAIFLLNWRWHYWDLSNDIKQIFCQLDFMNIPPTNIM